MEKEILNTRQKILVTGTCGFILSNFIRTMVTDHPEYHFICVDNIVEPINLHNIFKHPNVTFYMNDIADWHTMENIFKLEKPDFVINGAAESFVDNSITSAMPFVHSNITGVQVLLDLSVKYEVKRFLQISTDEVYGQLKSIDDAPWTEDDRLLPRNPYSASKAAAEMLVRAAMETHKLPCLITRCCNNFGPRQNGRNLIPRCINSILNNQVLPVHGSGVNLREWINVADHNKAVLTVLEKGIPGEIYNIGSGIEKHNVDIIRIIERMMDKKAKLEFITDRKGHDFRYSVDCSKIRKLGWEPENAFEKTMKKTIGWCSNNKWFYA